MTKKKKNKKPLNEPKKEETYGEDEEDGKMGSLQINQLRPPIPQNLISFSPSSFTPHSQ